MSTKAKGIFKGLRYISQIFDENKEPEMQIGLPTDVKHVAHIGWDGPSADSPSWMKGFESSPSGSLPSSPMNFGELKENSCEWPCEDSRRGLRTTRDQPDLPKSTRRVSSKYRPSESVSPTKQRSRNSRRHHLKDSESTRLSRDASIGTFDSPSNDDLSEVQKKSRRKKPRDPSSSRSSRSRNRGSGSGSGSSFASCTDLDSSVKSTYSNKEDKESIEAC